MAAFLWLIYSLIRDVSNFQIIRWLTGVILVLTIGVFAMTLLWGLNNYNLPIEEKLNLSGEEYSLSQLKKATIYYRDKANETEKKVQREENGSLAYDSFRGLAQDASDGYTLLSVKYDCFRGPIFRPKRLVFSGIFGIEGVFVPFTGESGVSTHTYSTCIPFVMCREMAYGCGFSHRGEADFAAFLACTASDSPELTYSGYFNAFSLCYNALYAKDPKAAREVWNGVSQGVRQDCAGRLEQETKAWTRIMNKLQDEVRDAYAETFPYEEEGSDRYSAADLLTMWYMEEIL